MTDTHTHTHTRRQRDASDPIICPMVCYSNGTDNKKDWPEDQNHVIPIYTADRVDLQFI